LGVLAIHFPAAFPKLFVSQRTSKRQKGFSLTSGLVCGRIEKKIKTTKQPFWYIYITIA